MKQHIKLTYDDGTVLYEYVMNSSLQAIDDKLEYVWTLWNETKVHPDDYIGEYTTAEDAFEEIQRRIK